MMTLSRIFSCTILMMTMSHLSAQCGVITDELRIAAGTMAGNCGTVSYQGYDYQTVIVGDQCWFKENLRSENYANGDAIPADLTDAEWSSTTLGAVAVYGEGASTCNTNAPDGDACDDAWSLTQYGRLYNWYAVDDARGLCPSGWHVPTDEEWKAMEMALGMSQAEADGTGWRGTDEGSQMKATSGWSGTGNGTNSSDFSALPGSGRAFSGSFDGAGNAAGWWTSSINGGQAWFRYLYSTQDGVVRNPDLWRSGWSVRCVQDPE